MLARSVSEAARTLGGNVSVVEQGGQGQLGGACLDHGPHQLAQRRSRVSAIRQLCRLHVECVEVTDECGLDQRRLGGSVLNTVAMPTSARRATSSVEPAAPCSPNTASAATRMRSRLAAAFLRTGPPCRRPRRGTASGVTTPLWWWSPDSVMEARCYPQIPPPIPPAWCAPWRPVSAGSSPNGLLRPSETSSSTTSPRCTPTRPTFGIAGTAGRRPAADPSRAA